LTSNIHFADSSKKQTRGKHFFLYTQMIPEGNYRPQPQNT
jgi:hypothetical protein